MLIKSKFEIVPRLGSFDGNMVGAYEGIWDGVVTVGWKDGKVVAGESEGDVDGENDGALECGACVGKSVDGLWDGETEGMELKGNGLGELDGRAEGSELVGNEDGNGVGEWVSWQAPLVAPFNA